MLKKKTDGKTKVQASLEKATTLEELGYIKNFCKFVANHPTMEVIFGTTRNEAFHKQLKSFYRNVMFQTHRNALRVADIATLAKLFAGFLLHNHEKLANTVEEHSLLERLANILIAEAPTKFAPLMSHKIIVNPAVDQSSLQQNAKRMRKRSRND